MITGIASAVFGVLCIGFGVGAFRTLCRSVRYRDAMVDLDADRIAQQPFQPSITILVRYDLARTKDPVPKIQELLSLNYTRYNVILAVDPGSDPESYGQILSHFRMESVPVPPPLAELRFPVKECRRSASPLFRRLRILEKRFHPCDDLRHMGAELAPNGYMLFLRSLDCRLTRGSLANLAIMKMRAPQDDVVSIRGVARYDCEGTFAGSFFRMMADLCNLRRVYVTGSFRGGDYGQFVELWDTSGKKGRQEYVPKPQMFIRSPESFHTYLEQLAPHNSYMNRRGKLISGMELLVGLLFWWGAGHLIAGRGGAGTDVMFMPGAFLIAVTASAYSIWVGEALLKKRHRIGFVFRLIPVSIAESFIFCLLQPWVWAFNFGRRSIRMQRNSAAHRGCRAPR